MVLKLWYRHRRGTSVIGNVEGPTQCRFKETAGVDRPGPSPGGGGNMWLARVAASWSLAAAPVAPVVACPAGHPNVWCPVRRMMTVSRRGLCWQCGDQMRLLSEAGHATSAARRSAAAPPEQPRRVHVARMAEQRQGNDQPNDFESTVVSEIWADGRPNLAAMAARIGAASIRIVKPTRNLPHSRSPPL